jgi:hypothetical protein
MLNASKSLLKNGLDPSAERKMEKLFEVPDNRLDVKISVHVSNDAILEIWKGKIAIRLTPSEASFIKNQLCKLIE